MKKLRAFLRRRANQRQYSMSLADFRAILAACSSHMSGEERRALLALGPGAYKVGAFGKEDEPRCPWAAAGLWELPRPTNWEFIDRFDATIMQRFGSDMPETFWVKA